MIDEYSIQRLVEQLRRHRSFKLIEPNIQIYQLRQAQNNIRKLSGKPVIAQVELEQCLQILKSLRQGSAETVGINVENAEIPEKAELLRQIAGNVAVVEINSGDGAD